jgi:regulatory protein
VSAESAPDPLDLAYRYLNRRERTVAEVRSHLLRRGCDAGATEAALEELQRDGLIDDSRYVRLFVEDKRALEHWGNDRITRALQERGIDRELIDQGLAPTSTGEGELERAVTLLRRRFPEPPQDRRARDRAIGVLVRKGYDPELALDALARYASDTPQASLR